MFTLNVYAKPTKSHPAYRYLFSISQNTRKQCLAIANEKYSDFGWDWDDKNYVKNKKFNSDPSTATHLSLSDLI